MRESFLTRIVLELKNRFKSIGSFLNWILQFENMAWGLFITIPLFTFILFTQALETSSEKTIVCSILISCSIATFIGSVIGFIDYREDIEEEAPKPKTFPSDKLELIKYELQIFIDKLGKPEYSLPEQNVLRVDFKLPRSKYNKLYNPNENILTDIEHLQEKLNDEKIEMYIQIYESKLTIFNKA